MPKSVSTSQESCHSNMEGQYQATMVPGSCAVSGIPEHVQSDRRPREEKMPLALVLVEP